MAKFEHAGMNLNKGYMLEKEDTELFMIKSDNDNLSMFFSI